MGKKKNKKKAKKRADLKQALKQASGSDQGPKSDRSKPLADIEFNHTSLLSEIKTADWFYPVSIEQAMTEYAKPLMEFIENDEPESIHQGLETARSLWNYEKLGTADENTRGEIIKQIRVLLGMDEDQAYDFVNKMIKRKAYLFPPEVQQELPMLMIMRKDIRDIAQVSDPYTLNISEDPVGPDNEDRNLIELINKVDGYPSKAPDWELHCSAMKKECGRRLGKWLIDKGLPQYSEDFPSYVKIYLNFIYRYRHSDRVLLKEAGPNHIEEFFLDYLLKNVIVEPDEYRYCIPALKVFYRFLFEKGYIEDPEPIIKLVDKVEPDFVTVLRERFG